MEPDLRKWNKPKKYCLALKCFPEILFPSYKVKSVTWISKRYLASEITAQIKSPKLWINLGDPDKMPCSVSGGGQTGSPGLLVVTRTDLDTSPRCHQGSRRWSPGQQTDREFFRLSNRLQDNRKVGREWYYVGFIWGAITLILYFSILPLIASLIIHSTKTTTWRLQGREETISQFSLFTSAIDIMQHVAIICSQ